MACQSTRCGSPGQGRSALAAASGRPAVPAALSPQFNRNGQILAAGMVSETSASGIRPAGSDSLTLSEASQGGAVRVAFSPDGQVLAAGSETGHGPAAAGAIESDSRCLHESHLRPGPREHAKIPMGDPCIRPAIPKDLPVYP